MKTERDKEDKKKEAKSKASGSKMHIDDENREELDKNDMELVELENE